MLDRCLQCRGTFRFLIFGFRGARDLARRFRKSLLRVQLPFVTVPISFAQVPGLVSAFTRSLQIPFRSKIGLNFESLLIEAVVRAFVKTRALDLPF